LKRSGTQRTEKTEDQYFDLICKFPLRPIRSKRELDEAKTIIQELTAEKQRGVDADDYLEVLSDLVQKYEFMNRPIADASPTEVLQFLMEERQINQQQLAEGSGLPPSTLSRILRGRQELNLTHIQKLANFLDVDMSLFLPASGLKRASLQRRA